MSLLARQSAGSLLARGAAPLALPKPRLLAWQCVRVDAAKVASAPRYFGVLYAMAMSSSVQDTQRGSSTGSPMTSGPDGNALQHDWVHQLELDSALELSRRLGGPPLRVLVLYGSLRERSYSKLLALEFSRILEKLSAEVRIFDPIELPMKDGASEDHPKVVELRTLSMWSEAQIWSCPEQHGTITAVFKNQIDWIPLSLGSVRPSQGRTLAVAQVNGGSQSFNTVNTLRVLGRWMRMVTIPNQSSVPKAWTEFEADGRMKPSGYRDRVVDVAEELFKFSLLLRGQSDFLTDRYSERKERRQKGRLLSQEEKEGLKSNATSGSTVS